MSGAIRLHEIGGAELILCCRFLSWYHHWTKSLGIDGEDLLGAGRLHALAAEDAAFSALVSDLLTSIESLQQTYVAADFLGISPLVRLCAMLIATEVQTHAGERHYLARDRAINE